MEQETESSNDRAGKQRIRQNTQACTPVISTVLLVAVLDIFVVVTAGVQSRATLTRAFEFIRQQNGKSQSIALLTAKL